jgi:hypothetical protein
MEQKEHEISQILMKTKNNTHVLLTLRKVIFLEFFEDFFILKQTTKLEK